MSIIDAINPYKRVIEFAAVVTAVALVAWAGHQFLEYERDIGRAEVQAKWNAQKLVDQEAALAKEAQWKAQQVQAEEERKLNEQRLQALVAALDGTAGSLRNAIAAKRAGLGTASPDAVIKTADSFGIVLDYCIQRYSAVAKAADGHVLDIRDIETRWPK